MLDIGRGVDPAFHTQSKTILVPRGALTYGSDGYVRTQSRGLSVTD